MRFCGCVYACGCVPVQSRVSIVTGRKTPHHCCCQLCATYFEEDLICYSPHFFPSRFFSASAACLYARGLPSSQLDLRRSPDCLYPAQPWAFSKHGGPNSRDMHGQRARCAPLSTRAITHDTRIWTGIHFVFRVSVCVDRICKRPRSVFTGWGRTCLNVEGYGVSVWASKREKMTG